MDKKSAFNKFINQLFGVTQAKRKIAKATGIQLELSRNVQSKVHHKI